MGGAGYIFSGDNDAKVMHNSATINLNVAQRCAEIGGQSVFYSSSACIYPEHNQLDPLNPNCEEKTAYPANPDGGTAGKSSFLRDFICLTIEISNAIIK